MPVVDSHRSCSTDFVRGPRSLLFRGQRMLFTDEVLLDPLPLELSDPLSLSSFLPVRCAWWWFLSSLVVLSPESLSPSCCCNEVPCSVADSVVNVVLVEVLGAPPLPLPVFRGVYGYLSIPCWTGSDTSTAVCTSLFKCVPYIMNAIISSQFWSTQCSSLFMVTVGFVNAFLMCALNSRPFSRNQYFECHKNCFVTASRRNLILLEYNSVAIPNCWVYVMISCISSFTDFQNTSGAVGQSYSHYVNRQLSLGYETLIEYPTGECHTSTNVRIIRLRFHRVVSTSLFISSGSIANLLDFFGT